MLEFLRPSFLKQVSKVVSGDMRLDSWVRLSSCGSGLMDTHAYYINDNNRHFSVLLIFIGGLPPFTEIYLVVYKNEWRHANKS